MNIPKINLGIHIKESRKKIWTEYEEKEKDSTIKE